MLTITGNGRLTRDVELRRTDSGKSVANLSVATDRRDRDAEPLYVELVLWNGAAENAAKYLIKGQEVSFSGRPDLRVYDRRNGNPGATLEIHWVELEYGRKPRRRDDEPAEDAEPVHDDIPF